MKANRPQFPALDALRALAAFGVIVYHVEGLKRALNLPSCSLKVVGSLGPYGVLCFFVLSGFLLSFLLFQEYESFGKISLSSFYRKRLLRIAPIYYLLLFWTLLFLPKINPTPPWQDVEAAYTWPSVLLHVTFLPQLALEKYPFIMGASQLWTIGLEMQFYLIWPLLFILLRKFPAALFLLSYFGFYLYRIAFRILERVFSSANSPILDSINSVALFIQIRPMIVGAFAGWVLHTQKKKLLTVVYHPTSQIISLSVLTFYFCWFDPTPYRIFQYVTPEPIFFAILILNLAGNPRSLLKLNWRALQNCGKFSYGIYIYHLFIAHLVIGWLNTNAFFKQSPLAFNLLAYPVIYAATIAVSSISYRYLELPILRIGKSSNATQANDTLKNVAEHCSERS